MRTIPIIALLLLAGCSTALPIAAGLGAAALAGGGRVVADLVREDVIETAEWRGQHKGLVAQTIAAMMAHARSLEDTDWDGARKAYQAALKFSSDNQPKILLERMRARLSAGDTQ